MKAFTDRPLTNADEAWWQLWRDRKADLKKAGFSIDKRCNRKCGEDGEGKCECERDGAPWLLTYEPIKSAPLRDDPELERKREAAWRDHAQAYAAAQAAIRAERAARIRARKMYTLAEWVAPLVNEALAVLGDPEPPAPAAESAKILQFRNPVLQRAFGEVG